MGCRPDLKGDENKWMETGCPVKSTSGQEGSLARGLSSTASVLGEPSLLGTTQEKIQYSGVRNCSNGPLYRGSPAQIDRHLCCFVLSGFIEAQCTRIQGLWDCGRPHCLCEWHISFQTSLEKSDLVTYPVESTRCAPALEFSQIQPVTTKISFQNYIWTKQVRMFLLSLLIQNSSTATILSFAFCFHL